MAKTIQRPTGTRDFYPAEMARRRYIEETWRAVGIRHAFDEIDGPTFEHLDLYTVKSGEGIVSELFSFRRAGGEKDFALRPEFTPTLARMYAAQAGRLPQPTKWFSICPFFRAERPQRGRLREFLQWNVDCIGGGDEDALIRADAEVIACCADAVSSFGVPPEDLSIRISNRELVTESLAQQGIGPDGIDAALTLLDKVAKLPPEEFAKQAGAIGLDRDRLMADLAVLQDRANRFIASCRSGNRDGVDASDGASRSLHKLVCALDDAGVLDWCTFDLSIVRGLAYYTGTVFEAIVAGERAVAGGGRYDKLIELFGGPPTPAVGFAMGDVVLSLVLEDRGLMPDDKAIGARLGLRPDVFVVASPNEGADEAVARIVAMLRGLGLHARRSYKATRNVGKLLKEAGAAGARFALIVESPDEVTIKHLETGAQEEHVDPGALARERFL